MWKKCYGAAIQMDAERFPDRDTPSRASFYRVVKLLKQKKNTENVKATKKLKQTKITKWELEFTQRLAIHSGMSQNNV